MTEPNKLEKWLKDNNLSKLLQTLLDNEVSKLSDLTEIFEDESEIEAEIDEFIEELNIEDESDINQFKNALSILSKTNGSDSSDNKEINEIDNNETETETKISHGDSDGNDSNENDATRTQNIQYKALLKNGTNIVASKKREYITSKLKENEYAYKGGNGYNKQTVSIKTTIRDLNADKKEVQVKEATRQPEKLFADENHKIILVCGKTGTGKTTLINSMMNYIYNIKQDDKVRVKLIE
eukprot:117670_1